MKCPKCNKANVKIGKKNITQEIKGETIEFIAEAHICPSCNFSFFNDEQADTISSLASNAYRKKMGLLTSEEILAYRNQLGMTQQDFADFISVGIASVKRWEGIAIQDAAMDQLIRLKCDANFIENAAIEVDELQRAGEENGNRIQSREKLRELAKIMLEECKSPLFTYKGIFYSDFYHHKKHGIGITGSIYRRQNFGPVPLLAQKIFDELIQKKEIVKKPGHAHDFEVKTKSNWEIFDDQEQKTIRDVISYIRNVGHKKLVDLSHEEDGWINTPHLKAISYSFSKKLKALK